MQRFHLRGSSQRISNEHRPVNTSTTDGASLASDLRPREVSFSNVAVHLLAAEVCFLVPCFGSPKFERQGHSLITETHNLVSCGTTVLGDQDTSDQIDGYSVKQSYSCCEPARRWIRVSSVGYDWGDPSSDIPERVVVLWASKSPS